MHILAFIRGIFAQVALLREKYIRESFAYGEITQKIHFLTQMSSMWLSNDKVHSPLVIFLFTF